jgi:membrane-associated phospholipid phosphatase
VIALALLAWAAFALPRLRHGDVQLLIDVSAHDRGLPGGAAAAVVHLGDPLVQAALLLIGVAVALASGRREWAVAGLLVALGADLSTLLLKHLLAAPRFDRQLGWDQINADAFPSGHATAAFSMAFAWALFAPPSWRRVTAAVGVAAACLVSASVVVLRYHFPTDVLGGLAVAAAWTFGVCAFFPLVSSHTERANA